MRDVLRKVLIFVGLMILLAGLVLLAYGSVRSTELEQVYTSSNSLGVSGNLTSGNTYVLDIYSSLQWDRDWSEAGGYTNPQPVNAVITSPDGDNTSLTAYFYATAPVGGINYTVPSPYPTFVEVTYQSVDSNSLSVDTSYLQARFTVKNGGNYTARILQPINWTTGPPREMLFEEEVTENPSSFTNLLEGSGLVCLFTGAIVSVLAIRARKGTKIKRKPARAKSSVRTASP